MIDLRDLSAVALAKADFVEQSMLQALAWTLLHFLWQGAVLGLAAFILLRVVRPERAPARYAIGVATLALMLVACAATFVTMARNVPPRPDLNGVATALSASAPQGSSVTGLITVDPNPSPSARVLLHAPAASATASGREPLGPAVARAVYERELWRASPVFLLAIVTAWSLGVLGLSFRLIGGWLLTRTLARRAIDAVSPSVEAAAARIAERLRLRRAVRIFESSAVAAPTLVGWVKPVVLLPASALSGLSPDQLQAILAHELAHVRRHDYLINVLQSVVETLLFYHPATWWVSAQVREEREHCCDDVAVEVCGDRLVYVSALAELTSLTTHRGFALAATDGSLVGRVRRLLGAQRATHEPPPVWALLAVVVLALAGAMGASSSKQKVIADTTQHLSAAPAGGVVGGVIDGLIGGVVGGIAGGVAGGIQVGIEEQPPLPPTPPASPAPPVPPAPPAPPTFAIPPPPPWAPAFAMPPMPPAPPLPPSPPAHPAPPLPSSPPLPPPHPDIQSSSGHIQWSHNDEKLSVKWTGPFRLTDDERDIAWIEEGATVTISDGVLFANRIDLKGLPGGRIERTFSKNAFKREYEPEGRLFLADALQKLIHRSGMFAKERVARFLKQGGPDAVLAEIDRLAESSYVKRVYYTELVKQSELSGSVLSRVLQRVPADMKSDYDRATLLTEILKLPSVTDAHRAEVARAARNISSDYDQRRTLSAVMASAPLSSAVSAAVLDAAATVDSNHDRSLILIEVAQKGGITPATMTAYMALVRGMSSSYDQRRVLTAMATQPGLPNGVTVEAVRAAGAMSSSHDQSEMLLALIKRGGLTDAAADAFFTSAVEIDSSHDLSRVLRAVIAEPNVSDRIITGALRTAARISSSHDRANLLIDVAAKHVLSPQARSLYLSAAEAMGSSHDVNRALAALVRAERR
jgi:beta-lactamase regulating signal transducer with metallopeptidase domain